MGGQGPSPPSLAHSRHSQTLLNISQSYHPLLPSSSLVPPRGMKTTAQVCLPALDDKRGSAPSDGVLGLWDKENPWIYAPDQEPRDTLARNLFPREAILESQKCLCGPGAPCPSSRQKGPSTSLSCPDSLAHSVEGSLAARIPQLDSIFRRQSPSPQLAQLASHKVPTRRSHKPAGYLV